MVESPDWFDAWVAGRGAARTLVVVAHPDDEVLGCGAVLCGLADVAVIHVTDGAPRDSADAVRHGFASPRDYAAARADEGRSALALAGVPSTRVSCFGVPDQDASLHLAAIARRLAPELARADLVLTHAFEGGHSDHDAVAFMVQAASAVIEPAARPVLVEMPFYHAGPDGWVRQSFLPQPGAGEARGLVLDMAGRALKGRMIEAHRSQADTLRSFALDRELFRMAPPYDFTRRPHGGDLLYERHGWNLDWSSWIARVGQAGRELGVGESE